MTVKQMLECFQNGTAVEVRFGEQIYKHGGIYSISRRTGEDGRMHYYCTLFEPDGKSVRSGSFIEPRYIEVSGEDNPKRQETDRTERSGRVSPEEISAMKEKYLSQKRNVHQTAEAE